ncbi:MAG: Gfo/Idh/MocA family oxidoreductase [Planctomycetaceae bacterium]|nr:Gfo/Idh/MocA family oxidoreductase [Planctomycetaceae bacterium]
MTQSRRTFLKKSAALAGLASAFAISGTRASGQITGANDRLRVGVVGINGRGQSHISEFASMSNVEVAYLIDVDSRLFAAHADRIEKDRGYKPNTVQDLRLALDDKNLDAISVATCNHTHSLNTIWAVQAGKDVYVEKPCSHNVFEGRKCIEAAEKYKRIVQHGTQSRLSTSRLRMVEAARSGKYGTLKIAKGYCCKPRWTISYKPIETPPDTLAWDIWLGPAPMQPFHRNLVHYNWHWFWDTGNGDAGNQGVHEYDLCRWMTGKTLPNSVLSFGARYVNEPDKGFKDQGETPNQMLTVHDYGDVKILFETRGLVKKDTPWEDIVDVELYTDRGVIKGDSFTPYDSKEKVKLDVAVESLDGNPFANFVAAVRARDRSMLKADITEAHPSCALFHIGNISWRLGETASVENIRTAFGDDPIIAKAVNDVIKNTTDALPGLTDPQFTLGPKLAFDPAREKFVNNPAADKLLTRDYRTPYIVPENV